MSFMFSKDLTRLSFANKNAHHFYRALAMRPLAPPRALRNPLRLPSISASPHQSFHASTPNQRNAKANKERLDFRNKAKKSGGFRVVEEEKESKLDVRLKNRERGSAISQGHDPASRLRQDPGNAYKGRHALFRNTVLARFQFVIAELRKQEFSIVGLSEDHLNQESALFMDNVDQAFLLADQNVTSRDKNPLFWNLRDAFIQKDTKGLQHEIKYSFQSFIARDRFSKKQNELQQRLLDFRFPQEWLPGTREMQRTVHIHVGPTNSGKTYQAIKALENSKTGVYAGPLRLLATEVYQRLKAKGFPCALVTGEEVRQPEETDQYFTSCTVEMVPMNTRFDVAVIDEIQMLSDPDRGSAWTMALLGVQAKEVHVCGEERAVGLVESLCASVGDKCVIHRYKRLSPLKTMDQALDNDFTKLEKGDAVVAFNRLSLHALKRDIEKFTGRRCAIIYGSLPPEVRVQQAALFNDPDNDYDYVVASDAIGMGLNLEIRRVILESVTKFDGNQNRMLTFPEIKQIGGRAGRYRSATNPNGGVVGQIAEEPGGGFVTTMEHADLHVIKRAFTKSVADLNVAYISPPAGIVERFASYYPPGTPLSFILQRIRMVAVLTERFRISVTSDVLAIADIVQEFNIPIWDKLTFCHMPVRLKDENSTNMIRALARIVANNETGDFLSIKEIPLEYLDMEMNDTKKYGHKYLQKMESLHDAINQYVWLSYRYTGMFRDRELAFHVRNLVGERLMDLLDRLNFTGKTIEMLRKRSRLAAASHEVQRSAIGMEEDEVSDLDRLEQVIALSKAASKAELVE